MARKLPATAGLVDAANSAVRGQRKPAPARTTAMTRSAVGRCNAGEGRAGARDHQSSTTSSAPLAEARAASGRCDGRQPQRRWASAACGHALPARRNNAVDAVGAMTGTFQCRPLHYTGRLPGRKLKDVAPAREGGPRLFLLPLFFEVSWMWPTIGQPGCCSCAVARPVARSQSALAAGERHGRRAK